MRMTILFLSNIALILLSCKAIYVDRQTYETTNGTTLFDGKNDNENRLMPISPTRRQASADIRAEFCCSDAISTSEHWGYLSIRFDTDHEKNALQRIQAPIVRKPDTMLCAIFMNFCEEAVNLLYHNMRAAGKSCTWVVFAYKGDKRLLSVFSRYVSNHPNITIRHIGFVKNITDVAPIYCKDSLNAKSNFNLFNNSGVPKSVLYMELLPYLSEFERVLILDDDMDISEFSFDVFHDIMNCGFQSGCGPVLVQPLVGPQRRYF